MKHYFYIIILFFVVSTHSLGQSSLLKETKTNSVQLDFKKILIVGSGRVETRAFLELVTTKIIGKLKGKRISANYQYLGKDSSQFKKQLSTLLSDSSYSVVFLFQPLDSSHYAEIHYYPSNAAAQMIFGDVNSRRVFLEDAFDLQIYEPKQPTNIIWAAFLKVDCELDQSYQLDEIVRKIMSSLKANKIFR